MLKSLRDAVASKLDKEPLAQVIASVKETGAAAKTLLANERILEQLEKIGVAPLSKVVALEERVAKLEAELATLRTAVRTTTAGQA